MSVRLYTPPDRTPCDCARNLADAFDVVLGEVRQCQRCRARWVRAPGPGNHPRAKTRVVVLDAPRWVRLTPAHRGWWVLAWYAIVDAVYDILN